MAGRVRPLGLPAQLSDGVVFLGPFQAEDAQAHFAGEDAEMRRRFEAPGPTTLEHARSVILRWAAQGSAGTTAIYALRDETGRLAGGCEARRTSNEIAEVSYWVFPQFRGRGVAVRALRLLCEALQAVDGLERIEAHVDPDNLASRTTAERTGFINLGAVSDEALAGGFVSRVRYGRRLQELTASPAKCNIAE